MEIVHLFAGVPVSDYASAYQWYERLFGRAPDMVPQEGESVWHVAANASIYVVADEARAGRALLTLAVGDLEEHLAQLAGRTIAAEIVPGTPRRAVVSDPDGNRITFFES
jgi:predicted enzyme related to lactoylglutathione lyase